MRGTNLRNLRDRAEDARNENILLKKRLATAKRKIEVLEAKARANTPPKKLRLGKFSANSRSSRKAVTQLKDIASQLSPSVKSPSQTTILRNEKKEGLSVMSANISKLKGKPFSIMYDTSTRVSKKWLPILANAWVENEVAEVMIDMQDVPDTKAENLSTLIGERLGALKLSPTKYVTSTTDNTNSLSGKLGGCAALLDKKFKSKSFRVPLPLANSYTQKKREMRPTWFECENGGVSGQSQGRGFSQIQIQIPIHSFQFTIDMFPPRSPSFFVRFILCFLF